MDKAGKAPKRVYNDYQKNKRKQKSRLKKLLSDRSTDLGLPHDIVEYFIRVQKSLCQPADVNGDSTDPDTKMNLLANVCDQIKENPVGYCTHQIVSVTIQKLIAMMDIPLLEKFLSIVELKMLELIDDKCASHIIQTTLNTLANNNVYKMKLELYPHIGHLFDVLSENISELMVKMYASHVVCSYVQLLGGIKIDENITSSRFSRSKIYNATSKNRSKTQVGISAVGYNKTCSILPKYYQKKLKPIIKTITNYLDGLTNKEELSDNFVGVFICTLASTHRTRKSKLDSLIAPLFQLFDSGAVFNPSTSYIIQSMCIMGTDESFEQIKQLYIEPNFDQLLTDPCGNYVIQAYMSGVSDKVEAGNIAEKSIDKLDDILNQGNFQVVVKLIDLMRENEIDQTICERLTLSILSTFKFESTKPSADIMYQLLSTEPLDPESPLSVKSDDDSKFNYHGSLLVEKLLGISRLVVDSFCGLYIRHLKCIMCNRFSGHIVNAFIESPLTTKDDIRKIVKILIKEKNHVATIPLICSKYGSYSFECIWNNVNIELKEKIALALDSRRQMLENNHFGAIVSSNLNLTIFHSDRDAWKNSYNQ